MAKVRNSKQVRFVLAQLQKMIWYSASLTNGNVKTCKKAKISSSAEKWQGKTEWMPA